jgi:hypothetical protein
MLNASILDRLEHQLDALAFVLGDAPDEAVRAQPAPGKWSARDNLAHLGRVHELTLERLRRILDEDRPQLPRYRAEEDPEWARWQRLGTSDVLAELRRLRQQLDALVRGLSDDQLARSGVHPRFGEMTIPGWLEFFLLHEAHHLYQALARVGEASPGAKR